MSEKALAAHDSHEHEHEQHHKHKQHSEHGHCKAQGNTGTVLTIRAHSGLSGDIFLAGLLRMTELPEPAISERLAAIMPELTGSVRLVRRLVNHVGGWHAEVSLPHQHAHRTLADITALIEGNGMGTVAKALALDTFTLLAKAEAFVHEKKAEEVHFHEVGALDSILDICMTCELFTLLAPSRLIVSPLPLADGSILCAHGIIPVPAPAVLELLEGIPVRPFSGQGETVTPTAIALLRSLGAVFGAWPAMRVEKQALVYGTHVFAHAPNGAVFAWGRQETAE
jgi:pyridinium-3,5-bisthiocarboxylic acid mononucleotide nickel chelatase